MITKARLLFIKVGVVSNLNIGNLLLDKEETNLYKRLSEKIIKELIK